jgi:hypothetical protein
MVRRKHWLFCDPEESVNLRATRYRLSKAMINLIDHFKDGFIKDSSVESITKIGTVTYKAGSTTIRDDGKRLIVLPDTSQEALKDILQVAMKKYGSHLAINGTESFRLEIAEVAAQNQMRMTFDDKRLEQYRQQLMKQYKYKAQSVGQKRSIPSTTRRSL